MTTRLNVFLCGPMGAGKSTTGKLLAQALGLPFVDLDREIETRTGASIPLIFELEGEAGFRQRESLALDEITQRQGQVLALGGGAVLRPENRAWLRARGVVVYLHASPEQQLKRVEHDHNRPLLRTEDRLGRLRALMHEREPIYRELADIIISTDGEAARRVAQKIVAALGAYQTETPAQADNPAE